MKLSDVRKKHGDVGPLGSQQVKGAQLFSRAQFTPDEVTNLRHQFEELDFVRPDEAGGRIEQY